MTYSFDEYNYTLRFERGEEFVSLLTQFVVDHDIKGGWAVGLGGLSEATLGFYDGQAQEYAWTKFDEPLELTNVTGNIAWQSGKPALHLHATISDTSLHASGGHLKSGVVSGTVEVFIYRLQNNTALKRSKDEQTGLNLLQL